MSINYHSITAETQQSKPQGVNKLSGAQIYGIFNLVHILLSRAVMKKRLRVEIIYFFLFFFFYLKISNVHTVHVGKRCTVPMKQHFMIIGSLSFWVGALLLESEQKKKKNYLTAKAEYRNGGGGGHPNTVTSYPKCDDLQKYMIN